MANETPTENRHERDAELLQAKIQGIEAVEAALYVLVQGDVEGIPDEFAAKMASWLELGLVDGSTDKNEILNRIQQGREEVRQARKQLELQLARARELTVDPSEGTANSGF